MAYFKSKCAIGADGRVCNRCNTFKIWENFWKDNRDPHGYGAACKNCANKDRTASRDLKRTYPKKITVTKSPEEIRLRKSEYAKAYREAHKEKQKETIRIYREANKEKLKKYFKERAARDKEKISAYNRSRRHLESFRLAVNKRRRDRLKTDPIFRFKTTLRNRLRLGFKARGLSKERRTIEYLGMSYPQLRDYIQDKFLPGMTWDNYGSGAGKWNLDHILPLSMAETQDDLLRLCHYTNLQPLWHMDNLIKGNRVPEGFEKLW